MFVFFKRFAWIGNDFFSGFFIFILIAIELDEHDIIEWQESYTIDFFGVVVVQTMLWSLRLLKVVREWWYP